MQVGRVSIGRVIDEHTQVGLLASESDQHGLRRLIRLPARTDRRPLALASVLTRHRLEIVQDLGSGCRGLWAYPARHHMPGRRRERKAKLAHPRCAHYIAFLPHLVCGECALLVLEPLTIVLQAKVVWRGADTRCNLRLQLANRLVSRHFELVRVTRERLDIQGRLDAIQRTTFIH